MADEINRNNLHLTVEVNKIFKREPKFGALEPWQIVPFLLCFLLGFGVTIGLSMLQNAGIELPIKGNYITWVFFTALPFFGWIWAVGKNPQRFFTAMNKPPVWSRGRPKHHGMLSKTRAASLKRIRRSNSTRE